MSIGLEMLPLVRLLLSGASLCSLEKASLIPSLKVAWKWMIEEKWRQVDVYWSVVGLIKLLKHSTSSRIAGNLI